jgi:hypothetical protein
MQEEHKWGREIRAISTTGMQCLSKTNPASALVNLLPIVM